MTCKVPECFQHLSKQILEVYICRRICQMEILEAQIQQMLSSYNFFSLNFKINSFSRVSIYKYIMLFLWRFAKQI